MGRRSHTLCLVESPGGKGENHMTDAALLTMIAVLGSVWGGFVSLLILAFRRESRKTTDQQSSDA
jgi:hypothetical protein